MHTYNIIEDGAPIDKAQNAMILLHGRGANAEDILMLADEFNDGSVYVAAPQATGNEWYPYSFLKPEELNEPWLSSAVETVKRLVREISVHIPVNKIYIMGFSQGACLALEFAARFPAAYAGIAAFSGGLIGEKVNPEKYNGSFSSARVFIGNSDADPYIPVARTSESAEILKYLDANVLYRIYPGMGHTITDQEINDVKDFMFPFPVFPQEGKVPTHNVP